MAEKRTYEVVILIDSKTANDDVTQLIGNLRQTVEKQGGEIVKSDDWGVRNLAYEIDHRTNAHYWLFEIDGSGGEIAELERRMRVNDAVFRYLTVRVDLDRRRAKKFKDKRDRKRAKRRNNNNIGSNANQNDFAMQDAAEI